MTKPMPPEQKQEYKDSIDSAVALLMEFRRALDNPPRSVSSCCAYCDEVFEEVESGECPPALLEHAKTCAKSPPANEIKRLQGILEIIATKHNLLKGLSVYGPCKCDAEELCKRCAAIDILKMLND